MKNATLLFFSICALLLLTPISGRAAGPEAAEALAAQQKGRLWTIAVHRGWPDYAPDSVWATHEEFYAWLGKQSGPVAQQIKTLRTNVHALIEQTYQRKEATPTELANALKRELPALLAREGRPLVAANLESLKQELDAVINPELAASAPPAAASAVAPVTVPETTNEQPEAVDRSEPAPQTTPLKEPSDSSGFFWGLGGLGIGFLLGRASRGSKTQTHGSSDAASRTQPNGPREEIDWTPPRKKTTARPPANTAPEKPQATNSHKRPPVLSQPVLPIQPMETPIEKPAQEPAGEQPAAEKALETAEHMAGDEVVFNVPELRPAAAAAVTQLYGPAPDVPTIEARKLTPQSLPQMPICLRLNQPQAITGSFVLNPLAEQSRLIGNGIRELKTFFDFDLPLPDNFSFISTSKPGKMELRDGTWHLVEKAKIELK